MGDCFSHQQFAVATDDQGLAALEQLSRSCKQQPVHKGQSTTNSGYKGLNLQASSIATLGNGPAAVDFELHKLQLCKASGSCTDFGAFQ